MKSVAIRRMLLVALVVGTALAGLPPGSALGGDKYAFLVAVRQYNKAELTSLEFTENDISRLAEVLRSSGYDEQNLVLMTQEVGAKDARFAPFSRNIVDELDLLLDELREDDSVVVAFAGHGVQFKGDEDAYFCPADARLKEKETLVSLGNVYQKLRKCQAGSKVLFVDACRNDPQSRLSRAAAEVELEAVGRPQRVQPPGGVAAFFSCSAGQKSFEHPDLRHGVFFHYVAEGLSGHADLDRDGEITLAELEQYAVKNVQRYVRTELGQKQTPERRGEARGLLTLSVVRRAEPSIPPPPPPPPAIEPPPTPQPAPVGNLAGFSGRWVNAATNSTYNIGLLGGRPALTSIVDDNGEEFPVWFSVYDDDSGALYWKYKVRSSGHIVEELVRLQAGGSLAGDWISTSATGEQQKGADSWQRAGEAVFEEFWRGQWAAASTGALYHIRLANGQPTLASVIDDDGEVYTVLGSTWGGDNLRVSYKVPSTGYTVDETLRLDSIDGLSGNWTSTSPTGTANQGTDTWRRSDAHRLDGAWVADSTQSTFTIRVEEGRPELASIVDDDGEVYAVRSFSWNGQVMQWKYFVPSTGYTVEETINAYADENTLTGEWTSTPPMGESTKGTDTFRRSGAPRSAPPEVNSVVGQWMDDSTNCTFTVRDDGNGIRTVAAVDDDGEVYQVRDSSWDGTTLVTTYHVPSTGYTLTESLSLTAAQDALTGNGFAITPTNTRNEFSTRWSRVGAAPVAVANSAWRGNWLKQSTQTTFTVEVGADNVPRVTSIIDDDGEVFVIQASDWDGSNLRWKYLVPSTKYVLEETVSLNGDTLTGTFKSTPPNSASFTGEGIWNRK
jgi:hypothetical protein